MSDQGAPPPESPRAGRARGRAERAYRRANRPFILRHKILSGFVALIVVIVLIEVATSSKHNAGSGQTAGVTPSVTPSSAGVTPSVAPSSVPAAPQYTATQQQAIDAAKGYLSEGEGFSRAGLIAQLHSPDGSGFAASVARFAVGHVSVNWRQQAVIAAKGYMALGEGFSYSGLVQQLDSPDGSQFTVSQAEYAAKAVGL